MAGKNDREYKNVKLTTFNTSDSTVTIQSPHAIELFTLDLSLSNDSSLFESGESKDSKDFREKHQLVDSSQIVREDDYLSSDDRDLFQNKVINGFDVLTLTIVRIFLQVAYKEFTGEDTAPFMEAITADPRLAGPIVALLCLLAFIEIYQAYQKQQATKLRNSPAQLAKFRQDSKEKKDKTAKQQIEDLQVKIDMVVAHDEELRRKYQNLSVQYQITKQDDIQKCKVFLVPAPKSQDKPENSDNSSAVIPDEAKLDTAEATKKNKNGINWPSVGSFAWELLNISAVVYWLEWGLRNLVKPGGFGVGFGTASGMNIVVPFGIVVPVIVPLALLAPKLFNYINNHHSPTKDQPTLYKLWNGVKKLFKPYPNPLEGTRFQFLGYLASETVNFFRYLAGFFLVAPTALGISVKKLVSSGKSTPIQADKVAEDGSKEFLQQFTADAPSILSRVILLDKYETLIGPEVWKDSAVPVAANLGVRPNGSEELGAKLDLRDTIPPTASSLSLSEVDSEGSKDLSERNFLLSPQSKSDGEKSPAATESNKRRGLFSWFSLFALRSAIGYIYLQFTLGWWMTDLITIFNPSVDITIVATIMAAAIVAISLAYALTVTIYRKRQYEEYHAPKDKEQIAQKIQRNNALELLAEAERGLAATKEEAKKYIPPEKIAEIEQSPQYENCPKIDDKRYYADIRSNDKTWNFYALVIAVGGVTAFIARAETGIWIGRAGNIDGTAVHPWFGLEPWNRTIPWENRLSGLDKHLAVVFTVLGIAALYVAVAYYNEYQDGKIDGEKQKAAQVKERLLHINCEKSLWDNQINFWQKKADPSTDKSSTRTPSPGTTSSRTPSPEEGQEGVPLLTAANSYG